MKRRVIEIEEQQQLDLLISISSLLLTLLRKCLGPLGLKIRSLNSPT